MRCSQQTAFIVTPCFDLHTQSLLRRLLTTRESSQPFAYQYDTPFKEMLITNVSINCFQESNCAKATQRLKGDVNDNVVNKTFKELDLQNHGWSSSFCASERLVALTQLLCSSTAQE